MFDIQVLFNKQTVTMGLLDNLDDFFFLQTPKNVTTALQRDGKMMADMIQSGRSLLPMAEDPDGSDEKMGVGVQLDFDILHLSQTWIESLRTDTWAQTSWLKFRAWQWK